MKDKVFLRQCFVVAFFAANVVMLHFCSLCFRESQTRVRLLHYYKLCIYEPEVVLAMYETRALVSHNKLFDL
jgi:hypothetical protein